MQVVFVCKLRKNEILKNYSVDIDKGKEIWGIEGVLI